MFSGEHSNIPFHGFRFAPDDPIPFEIIQISQSKSPRTVDFSKPNRVNFYEILWVTHGSGTRFIDFKSYRIQPDCVFFLVPGQVHFWQVKSPLNGYVILFLDEFLSIGPGPKDAMRSLNFFRAAEHDPFLALDDQQAAAVGDTVDLLLAEYAEMQAGRSVALQSLLRYLLVQFQRSYSVPQPVDDPSSDVKLIERFQQLIDQQFLTLHRVCDYAEILGTTPGYLTTLTRQTTGQSAGALIRSRIILEAKRLLVHTDRPVAEIGFDLHFEDPSYFARFFRREVGLAPTAFREDFRKKYQSSRI